MKNSKFASEKWVEAIQRLWERMASKYGFDVWEWRYGRGEMGNPAFEEWASDLATVQPKATATALNNLPEKVPTLPQFMALCRSFEKSVEPKPETNAERQERLKQQDLLAKKIKQEMEKPVVRLGPVERGKVKHMIARRWPNTHCEDTAVGEWLRREDELDRQLMARQDELRQRGQANE